MPPPPPDSPAFRVALDTDQDILTAHWAGPVPDVLLMQHCTALLAAAHREGRRHYWLFDLRGRPWPGERFEHWFSRILAPRAAQELGHPIFVACVLDLGQGPAADSPAAQSSQRECTRHDVYTYYFDNEAAARAWLRHQMHLAQPLV